MPKGADGEIDEALLSTSTWKVRMSAFYISAWFFCGYIKISLCSLTKLKYLGQSLSLILSVSIIVRSLIYINTFTFSLKENLYFQ